MDIYVAVISAVAGLFAIIAGMVAFAGWSRPRMAKWWMRRRDPTHTGPSTHAATASTESNAQKATAKKELGKLHRQSGDFPEAHRLFTEAYDDFVTLGHIRGQANALMNRGILFRMMNQWMDSEQDHANADSLFRQASDPRGQADNLKNFGSLYRDMGNQRRAIEILEQSLRIYESLGAKAKIAELKQQIGTNFAQLGDTDTAREYLASSLRDSGDGHATSDTQG